MRKISFALGAVALAALAALALVKIDRLPGTWGAARAASAVSPPLQFTSAEVVCPQRATMPRVLQFSGPLVAPNTAVVRAKAAGSLLALAVAEGQRVAAGQALGRIDVAELSNRVAERDALLESARAALAQAQRTHASNERLAAQAFISPVALDASRAQLDGARAAWAAAQAARDSTRVGLRDAVPTAPIAGIVAKRHVLPGEKVAVEQALATIVDLRTLELAASVGTHEVAQLTVGMPAELTVEGLERPVAGRLARIAPAADAGTRSIGVAVALDNPGERLRAGQYAIATVVLHDDRARLTLPLAALAASDGASHVWVIERGVLARRSVTTGRVDEVHARVEVLSGLEPGAQVLAARFDNLREGAAARVVGAPSGASVGEATAQAAASVAPPLPR